MLMLYVLFHSDVMIQIRTEFVIPDRYVGTLITAVAIEVYL